MKRVSFYTLGCKLNQAESATIAASFRQHGYEIVDFGQRADICFVNTCSVTERAEQKSRQIVRRVVQTMPRAIVVVAGCYCQLHPEVFSQTPGVNLVLGTVNKFDVLNYLTEITKDSTPLQLVNELPDSTPFCNPEVGYFTNHTRAFLKIQEGCDMSCSYCSVPLSRGRSRSGLPEQLVRHAQKLVEQSFKEIVLTGVHIGAYGHDLHPRTNLVQLLKKLLAVPGLERIRLSSIDPNEISQELIELVARENRICPHFHIPLQSGDDEILQRMNRSYRVARFRQVVNQITQRIPEVNIGTDVIVGFPGETDRHFENTYRLLEELPIGYLHVFSFSPRPGTPAASFTGQIDQSTKKKRSQELHRLNTQKKLAFASKFIGGSLQEVLVERNHSGNMAEGLSKNYLRVFIDGNYEFNQIVLVQILQVGTDGIYGKVVKENSRVNAD